MAMEWFQQGPMSKPEAIDLAERYRKSGKRVDITPSFQPEKVYVMVLLSVMNFTPRSSNVYQNKLWK